MYISLFINNQHTKKKHTANVVERRLIMSHVSSAAGMYTNKCTLTRDCSHQMPSCTQTQTERHETLVYDMVLCMEQLLFFTSLHCRSRISFLYIQTGILGLFLTKKKSHNFRIQKKLK